MTARLQAFLRGIIATTLFVLCLFSVTFAQTAMPVEEEILPEMEFPFEDSVDMPEGTASCFDYYTFGSVQADLATSVTNAVSGTPITFSGSLKNDNPYPIVDGALYVKVFKMRGDKNDGNGPDVVDQYMVKGDIAIPAHGEQPITFVWNIPAYAASGDYQLATFFTTSRKFNLLGLSFTDDIVGNTVSFKVMGNSVSSLGFLKDSVALNANPYYFAAYPPRVTANEPVLITANIKNPFDREEKANVSWTVYQWDGQLRENVVQESKQEISIPARGTLPTTVTITNADYPVYLVVGVLSWRDTKSILGVRFVRTDIDRARINFPGVTKFPLVKGEPVTLFSCLHNSGNAAKVSDSRLELFLSDAEGNLIHKYTYAGDVTGQMMGVAETFVPKGNHDYFVLDALLYQDEEFVDAAHLVYDCEKISPGSCTAAPEESGEGTISDFLATLPGGQTGVVVIVIALALLCGALWRLLQRKSAATSFPQA